MLKLICRYRLCVWIFALAVFMFVFVMVLILPLRYSNPVHDNEDNPTHAPVDTAIVSFPHPFCDKLSITKHNYDEDFPVISTLYLLEKMPTLGKQDSAVFYREPLLSTDQYEFWKIFLYPGSNISYQACSLDSLPEPWGKFYLVKGNDNFARWKDGDSNVYLHEENIDAACQDTDNSTYTFKVNEEENYYFIFERGGTSQSRLGVTFSYDRVLYDTSSNVIISECSIYLNTSSSCHVDIPVSSKTTALLELDTLEPDLDEWDANISLDVECAARVWLYAVIAISVFVFLGVLISSSAILYYLCSRRRRRSVERGTHEDSAMIEGDNTPPTYDTYDAPPAYKPE